MVVSCWMLPLKKRDGWREGGRGRGVEKSCSRSLEGVSRNSSVQIHAFPPFPPPPRPLTMELHDPPMSFLIQGQKFQGIDVKRQDPLYPLMLLLQPLVERRKAPLQVGLGGKGGKEGGRKGGRERRCAK